LEEIRKLCDTATILRLGKKVETCTPRKTSSNELAEMMVGSSIQIPLQKNARPAIYFYPWKVFAAKVSTRLGLHSVI
jgi:simple sugar transport system ATP-binding protein